ncbi:unnamed protein product [Lampetra fluviatilis]
MLVNCQLLQAAPSLIVEVPNDSLIDDPTTAMQEKKKGIDLDSSHPEHVVPTPKEMERPRSIGKGWGVEGCPPTPITNPHLLLEAQLIF